jgi:hypothetical protein
MVVIVDALVDGCPAIECTMARSCSLRSLFTEMAVLLAWHLKDQFVLWP